MVPMNGLYARVWLIVLGNSFVSPANIRERLCREWRIPHPNIFEHNPGVPRTPHQSKKIQIEHNINKKKF